MQINGFESKSYAKTILRLKSTLPDKTEVYRAIWENIAMLAIPYDADILPVDMETIDVLQTIQCIIGISILSTANEVVELELGLKPILRKVLTAKIKFFLDTTTSTKDCYTSRLVYELT